MRLIDADELEKKLNKLAKKFMSKEESMYIDISLGLDIATTTINEIATIDPIKHGHWKFYPGEECYIVCSECGKEYYYDKQEMPNYCPNCGIKMAEETNKEDVRASKVKYGYWRFRRIGKGYIRECSECHTWPKNLSDEDLRYCKNCGAKMIEEKT